MAQLRILIVNFRVAPLVVDCLRSLDGDLRQNPEWEVAVIDNHSADNSLEVLNAGLRTLSWRDRVSLKASPDNRGFSAGNNQLLREYLASASDQAYLLLNPDTIVRSGAIEALHAFARARPKVGIVGPRLESGTGEPELSAFHFPSIRGELQRGLSLRLASALLRRCEFPLSDQPARVDWISGACLWIRREVFETTGLLDERFFLYFEEVDFCRRARAQGWECWQVPVAHVVHFKGGSTRQISGGDTRDLSSSSLESRRRYFLKHHGWIYGALADVTFLLARVTYRLRRWVLRKPVDDPPHALSEFLRQSVLLRGGSR